jgi:hypothetical protein
MGMRPSAMALPMLATASARMNTTPWSSNALPLIQNLSEKLIKEHQGLAEWIGIGDRAHIGIEVAVEILETFARHGHNDVFDAGDLFQRVNALFTALVRLFSTYKLVSTSRSVSPP